MISTFTAFFDANVFYGARLRSLVLYAAQTKIFRARWSSMVHEEWTRNLLAKREDLTPERVNRTRELMDLAVEDCLVEGFEDLIDGIDLPDPDDRHIVAAAIVTRASVIVTFNLADFPSEKIAKYRLEAKHPDEFLQEAFSMDRTSFAEAVIEDFHHYQKPPQTFEQYLADLAKSGVPEIAGQLAGLAPLTDLDQ